MYLRKNLYDIFFCILLRDKFSFKADLFCQFPSALDEELTF